MDLFIFEVQHGPQTGNWGKFAVGRLTPAEWDTRSAIEGPDQGKRLFRVIGNDSNEHWVLDLQTGEGAFFRLGGVASSDLRKHKIWVCPMFEPFLNWLNHQDHSDLAALHERHRVVNLPEAVFDGGGYRRPGGSLNYLTASGYDRVEVARWVDDTRWEATAFFDGGQEEPDVRALGATPEEALDALIKALPDCDSPL